MDFRIDGHSIQFSKDPKLLSKDKATIIFLHDSLGCIKLWKDFPQKIEYATGCNVLSYDRQGYGESSPITVSKRETDYLKKEAEVLNKILEIFSLENVILFGHSDGGSIALLAVALYPNRIIGIITEGAHVFVEKETIKGIKEAVKAYKTTNLKEKLFKYHGNKTDDVFSMWAETWLSHEFQSWNIEKCLKDIQCPSLIIQGEEDEYGTLDQVESIVMKTTGKSKPFIIKEVGHSPHKECSEVVINETHKFISGLFQ